MSMEAYCTRILVQQRLGGKSIQLFGPSTTHHDVKNTGVRIIKGDVGSGCILLSRSSSLEIRLGRKNSIRFLALEALLHSPTVFRSVKTKENVNSIAADRQDSTVEARLSRDQTDRMTRIAMRIWNEKSPPKTQYSSQTEIGNKLDATCGGLRWCKISTQPQAEIRTLQW
ncbi:hypothetical protein B0H10DRAFT_2188129 [Mycena sp. CBHHK59/15]|nr:hypothetical protein B0H10DRAFT_2188129 [Mycena sp. CBHHK59/15]